MMDTGAFLVCMRLGLTQARHWAATEEAWIYEAPAPVEAVSCSTEGEMVKVMEMMADKGHDVIQNFRGGLRGHRAHDVICSGAKLVLRIGRRDQNAHLKLQVWKGKRIS